jgi:hypothetical protein
MFSANGNFYKNSHIIENMDDVAKGDDNVNPFTIDGGPVRGPGHDGGPVRGPGHDGSGRGRGRGHDGSGRGHDGSGRGRDGSGRYGVGYVTTSIPTQTSYRMLDLDNINTTNVGSSGNQNPREGIVLSNMYGENSPNKQDQPSGIKGVQGVATSSLTNNIVPPNSILITWLAADSKKIYLDKYEYLNVNQLDNNFNLFNDNTKPLIKKIIEINIYFNIYNNTNSPTNNKFTVNTNKQVTFEYNYYYNNKYLNNFTKITLGNDDLSKFATDHTFTIDIKPKSIIRCKLTVMPNTNEIYSETITYEPEIIIKNLKNAINKAGTLV